MKRFGIYGLVVAAELFFLTACYGCSAPSSQPLACPACGHRLVPCCRTCMVTYDRWNQ